MPDDLERIVARHPRRVGLGAALLLATATTATVALVLAARASTTLVVPAPPAQAAAPAPPPVVVTIVVPAPPPVVVTIVVPAPPPTPPPLDAACPADLALTGALLTADEPDDPPAKIDHVDYAPTGCTVAASADRRLAVTWDGGRTSAILDTGSPVRWLDATATRILILRDDALGELVVGDPAIHWHDLGADRLPEQFSGVVVAGGAWLAIQLDTGVLLTSDTGVSHVMLGAPPPVPQVYLDGNSAPGMQRASIESVSADGVVRLVVSEEVALPVDGDPSTEVTRPHYFVASEGAPAWVSAPAPPPPPRAPRRPIAGDGWTYQFEYTFYGCGGKDALVGSHGAQRVVFADGLRSENEGYALEATPEGPIAMWDGRLYRLHGSQAVLLGDIPGDEIAVKLDHVDAAGAAVFHDIGHVFRWTPRGGFRTILAFPSR